MSTLTKNTGTLTRSVLASIPGTTAMTAFSYALSRATDKQFREPELLSYLLHQQPMVKVTRNYGWADKTSGFAAHYLAGAAYAAAYEYLWKPAVKLPTLVKGALFGVVAGMAGVAVWETVLSLRNDPPRLDKSAYYAHLVAAHVIFGAATAMVSKAMSQK